jgi:flagellar basal-body rod protein FlgB
MGMAIATEMSGQIERYLDLAAEEAKLTAENMANVDTPGYRAVGMDFEAEMREAVQDAGEQVHFADGLKRLAALAAEV